MKKISKIFVISFIGVLTLGLVTNFCKSNNKSCESQVVKVNAQEESDSTSNSSVSTRTKSSKTYVICIDAGHQMYGESATEPNGPGSSVRKARVTGGTTGRYTGIPEYKETLKVAKLLRKELKKRGYKVVMTRTKHHVSISNKERAQVANKAKADACIRLHCNGVNSSSVSGALTMATSTSNPYLSSKKSKRNQRLARCVINSYCKKTGMRNQGVVTTDTMTGLNWCKVPCTLIEMGYMTNKSDDYKLNNAKFQKKMVKGIADGIDAYFGR